MSTNKGKTAYLWKQVIERLQEEKTLVKSGNKYFCPFCENPTTSKSPSFSISAERGIAKCFGSCGATYTGLQGLVRFLKDLGKNPADYLPDSELPETEDLSGLVWYLNSLLWSDEHKRVRQRLLRRGIDLDLPEVEELVAEWPIGAFDPRVPDEVLKTEAVKKLWNKVVQQTDGFATVHGYIDPVTNKTVALKVIPFDPRDFSTRKDKIRFYTLEGHEEAVKRSYHGIPGILQESEKVYLVEGEFDALSVAAQLGWRNVIALGGQTSKGLFPDKLRHGKEFVFIPDQFGEKKGEELLFHYLKALPGAKVVNWYRLPEKLKVYEDPNDFVTGDRDEFEKQVTQLTQPAAEFVRDYLQDKLGSLDNPAEVLEFVRTQLLPKLSPQLYLELSQLPGFEFLPPELVRETVKANRPPGADEIDLTKKVLSQYFKPVYVDTEEATLFVKVASTGRIVPIPLSGKWNETFARLSLEVGEGYKEFFLSVLPFEPKEKESLTKFWNRVRGYVVDAFQAMAAEFAGKLKPDHKILEPGVHYIPEENKLVLVDTGRTYVVSPTGVEKTNEPILFGGRYVVRPLQGFQGTWLPNDLPWELYGSINPAEVYRELKQFFKDLVDLTDTPFEYQYDILPLVPLYGNAFDAYQNTLVISFHGNSGSGKTTLLSSLVGGSKKLPKLIVPATFLTDYTPAGIRQFLGESRLFVGLDEAEPEQFSAVMDTVRSMTTGEGMVVRGTKEQKVVATNTRFALATSMIYLPPRTQDVNRLIIFKTVKKTGLQSPAIRLRQAGWTAEKLQQLAYKTFLAGLKLALTKTETTREEAEKFVLSLRPDASPREVELQATLVEVAEVLGLTKDDNFANAYRQFLDENLAVKEQPSQEKKLLNEILTYQMPMERFGMMALSEVAYRLYRADDTELENITRQRGWFRRGEWLYVPLTSLGRVLEKIGYANFVAYLKGSDLLAIEAAYLKINLPKLAAYIDQQAGPREFKIGEAKL
jgi:GTPase SAR1 family protein